MSILPSIAIFIFGVVVGYRWALFEMWVDERERATHKRETSNDD